MRAGLGLVAITAATGGGCQLVFPIEGNEGNGDAKLGVDAAKVAPRVFSSPGPAAAIYQGKYAHPLRVTLATDDPTATIHYTVDGSPPTTVSPGGATPVSGIEIGGWTDLQSFGTNAAGPGLIARDVYDVDSLAQVQAGYVVSNTLLEGISPVVVAGAGATLAATTDFDLWVQAVNPDYTAQLVYGVNETDQGCLYTGDPGPYPGVQRTASFMVQAPNEPGIHEVRVAHIEELTCEEAMAMQALATRPTVARIGVIIVR